MVYTPCMCTLGKRYYMMQYWGINQVKFSQPSDKVGSGVGGNMES